jgi:hypothetical protein
MNEPLIKTKERRCYRELGIRYYGKVLSISYGNHGYFYILDNKQFLLRQWFTPKCQEQIKRKVEIGDSIYKPKGTWDFYIYKKANPDSVIFIDCDFDCNIYTKNKR